MVTIKFWLFTQGINTNAFVYNRYLLDHGADVSAINCDQELATDIAESDDMRQLLEQRLKAIGKLKILKF